MDPISVLTTTFSLARAFAPLVPGIVGDVKSFLADMDHVIAAVKKKDLSTTLADVGRLFDDVKTDLPTVTKVIEASKTLKL